jgi:hypothetical protein
LAIPIRDKSYWVSTQGSPRSKPALASTSKSTTYDQQ